MRVNEINYSEGENGVFVTQYRPNLRYHYFNPFVKLYVAFFQHAVIYLKSKDDYSIIMQQPPENIIITHSESSMINLCLLVLVIYVALCGINSLCDIMIETTNEVS